MLRSQQKLAQSLRQTDPWITSKALEANRRKRQLVRVWRRTKSVKDRHMFSSQVHTCNRLMSEAKSNSYNKLVTDTNYNYTRKLAKIRAVFPNGPNGQVSDGNIRPLTEEDVRKLLSKSPMHQILWLGPLSNFRRQGVHWCPPHPNNKHYQPISGRVCLPWQVQTGPCHTLTQETLFRQRHFQKLPPSFQPQLLIQGQIKAHIQTSQLDNKLQSAYEAYTIQRKLLYFLFRMIYLLQCDCSNTPGFISSVRHNRSPNPILNRLTELFGLGSDALKWVVSYLQHRFQSVQISSIKSNPMELIFGVPQGSVLGPLLFIMYTTPLSSLLPITRPRISNTTFTQMTHKNTIPSTHPVLIIQYTIF